MAIKTVSYLGEDWEKTYKRPGRYWEESEEAYRRVGQGHWLDSQNRWHTCYLVYVDWGERWLVDYDTCHACEVSGIREEEK